MAPVIPSMCDLGQQANRTQARYELNRAVDLGDQAQQAAWTLKWGEAAMQAAGDAGDFGSDWDFFAGPSNSLLEAAVEAGDLADALLARLSADKPDLAAAKAQATALAKLLVIVNTKLEPFEG